MSHAAQRWRIVETTVVRKHKRDDGVKTVNNYTLLQTLGHGRFAKVKLCERSATGSQRQFAMKVVSKKALLKMKDYVSLPQLPAPRSPCPPPPPPMSSLAQQSNGMRVITALDRVRDEIRIQRTLYHRNVVLLFEVIESEDSDKIYMVLEHMPLGPCMAFRPEHKDFVSPLTQGVLTDALARAHVRDILHGLEYLHGRGICHRDLKPDNVLLNAAGRCHLCDFGCALSSPVDARGDVAQLSVTDTTGTYQFLAPECCSGEPYDPFKVDIWAVGVMLFVFLFGKLPFQSDGTKELFDEITRCELVLPTEIREIDETCRDLLWRLLAKAPGERITLAQALSHPWLSQSEGDEEEEPPSF
ncbi:hypothetical protein P43SY_000208 [Pythium insidiosum]|uniref:Protein kinase domain-containing protein n=1 Tax=Pythium insidiosum TaxID=114742 RepID=A0AAD5QA16_PYTIN|nr:hypothetical protein P43SY_000208 [Pythium insidiosum]